tara:strand:+ start:1531 stop:1866 length:336 start_codon:yes stop_codon:yes gene_type:complete
MLRRLRASHPFREDVLEIYVESAFPEIRRRADRYLRQGYTLEFLDDDRREELVEEVEFDSSQSGSDQYTFHEDGERVLVHRYIAVVTGFQEEGGTVSRRRLRSVYRPFDSI